MQKLLGEVIDAHGGIDRWNRFSTLTAHLKQGGLIWPLKGKGGMLGEVDIQVKLHEPWTSHSPFGAPGRRTAVTPQRAAIESADGALIEEALSPRASFAGHQLDTPWSDLQLAYFVGYAIWNYLTVRFTLAGPGFSVEELSPWLENGEQWRRLRVNFLYVRDADGGHQPEPLVVSIDVSAIQFT